MMWGSDYPPSSAREGYANALGFPLHGMGFLSPAERGMAFGGTGTARFQAGG